jgi:hypothetical protein
MDSILTDNKDYCFFCGRPAECKHHLIFGSSNRQLADEDGLTIPACNCCHNMGNVKDRIHDNPMAEKMSKIIGQLAWENKGIASGLNPYGARELFRKRYGKSYL